MIALIGPGDASLRRALFAFLATNSVGHLTWEFAHMPLFTLWETGTAREIVFAALHCWVGDLLIASTSLLGALFFLGRREWPLQRFKTVATATILLGVGYTAFSEWLNVVVRQAWAYRSQMPTLSVFGFRLGLSPIAQWMLIPTASFYVVGRVLAKPRS